MRFCCAMLPCPLPYQHWGTGKSIDIIILLGLFVKGKMIHADCNAVQKTGKNLKSACHTNSRGAQRVKGTTHVTSWKNNLSKEIPVVSNSAFQDESIGVMS